MPINNKRENQESNQSTEEDETGVRKGYQPYIYVNLTPIDYSDYGSPIRNYRLDENGNPMIDHTD